jgi:hypothetical protein
MCVSPRERRRVLPLWRQLLPGIVPGEQPGLCGAKALNGLAAAVAQAYGWSDYTADMPDEEILKRLLALNLQRSAHTA